jgi:hypothetical protein
LRVIHSDELAENIQQTSLFTTPTNYEDAVWILDVNQEK